jgi:tetratricopeptide (TPR) repeat protein
LYRQLDRAGEAERAFGKAVEIVERLAEAYPSVPRYRNILTRALNSQALFYQANGQPERAERAARRCIEIQERQAKLFPSDMGRALELGGSYCNFGRRLTQNGAPGSALEWFDKAREQIEKAYKHDPKHPGARTYLRLTHGNRADALVVLNRLAEALTQYDRALELSDDVTRFQYQVERAVTLARLGKVDEAVAFATRLDDQAKTIPGDGGAYRAARIFSQASEASPQGEPSRGYADRAVKILRRLHAEGFFKNAENAISLKRDPDFQALASHPEYQKLLEELSKR